MAMPEKFADVVTRPGTKACPHVGAQARRVPGVELRAGEIERTAFVERLFLQANAPRGMAGTAMAEALYQVGATIPRGIMAGLEDIAAAGGKEIIPNHKRPTEAE